ASALIALLKTPLALRLGASVVALAALALLIGVAGSFLTPAGNTFARISPASGFWLLIFAFTLLLADVLTRLNLSPQARVGVLVVAAAAIGLLLVSGSWNSLSILKEYFNRADSFWAEGSKHVTLALGSLAAAVIIGLPLGILCHRVEKLRAGVLNVLNIIQTIPSIALFGLLIAPLGWVASHVPGAAALGIRGIGTAPAFVALFLYSLLPVVANTVVGLAGVPRAANDAARGMGMTDRQRLFGVEFPLAFPVILTGIRIVLVQNIGLATIAALIGGGGFGVFVFQGVGQTAMDLVLLGAVPTVALAFAAAIILDAVIEMSASKRRVETA
ncbi:MAG: ABC transporter permease, partial [Mesorhizobium sp.]